MRDFIAKAFDKDANIRHVQDKGNISFFKVKSKNKCYFIKYFDYEMGYRDAFSEFTALEWYKRTIQDDVCQSIEPIKSVRIDGDKGMLVTKYTNMIRGDKFLDFLGWLPLVRSSVSERAARWLALFHCHAQPFTKLKSFEECAEATIASLDKYSTRYNRHSLISKNKQIRSISRQTAPYGIIHKDYSTYNFFIKKGKICAFDFRLDQLYYTYTDAAKFIVFNLWRDKTLNFKLNQSRFENEIMFFYKSYEKEGHDIDTKSFYFFLIREITKKINDLENKISRKGHTSIANSLHIEILLAAIEISLPRLAD